MKPLAVFTIARNESFFLPRWLSYYSYLKADLFVLDHESADGSTTGIDAKVVPVHREHTDDVGWMLRTVTEFQHGLLSHYHRVLFAEVDEILCPDPQSYPSTKYSPLQCYLDCNQQSTLTATGYDVCNCPGDAPFDPRRPLLFQRKWKRNGRYDKTLISTKPLEWEVGFHRLKGVREGTDEHNPDPNLLLIHLHYMDREIAWSRLVSRMAGKTPAPGDWAWQNKYVEKEPFDRDFDATVEGAVEVPDRWRRML